MYQYSTTVYYACFIEYNFPKGINKVQTYSGLRKHNFAHQTSRYSGSTIANQATTNIFFHHQITRINNYMIKKQVKHSEEGKGQVLKCLNYSQQNSPKPKVIHSVSYLTQKSSKHSHLKVDALRN